MKENTKEVVKKLAEEHWCYVESICHKMYVDAFIHGWKHGFDNSISLNEFMENAEKYYPKDNKKIKTKLIINKEKVNQKDKEMNEICMKCENHIKSKTLVVLSKSCDDCKLEGQGNE